MLVAVCGLGLAVAHCSSDGDAMGEPSEDAEDVRAVLESTSSTVILPTYEEFSAASDELASAVGSYAESLEDDDLAAARDAWTAAMSVWQRAELMQVGPAAISSEPGGQDLRDRIYSWPEAANECRVDQNLSDASYEDASSLSRVNEIGLDALEYLLFYEGTDNACPPTTVPNSPDTWSELGNEELRQRRADYADTLAGLLQSDANSLVQAWQADGDDFLQQLAQAGDESSAYESTAAALDAFGKALYYLDLITKDRKLALPAGLPVPARIPACMATTCPGDVESKYSNVSKDNLLQNLIGFRQVLTGDRGESEGSGLDDLLRERDAGDLADQMLEDTEQAIAAIEAIDGSLQDALKGDYDAVVEAHNAVKKVTDALKGDFVTTLTITPPSEGGGDTD